jgi:hypothetical protein
MEQPNPQNNASPESKAAAFSNNVQAESNKSDIQSQTFELLGPANRSLSHPLIAKGSPPSRIQESQVFAE